MGAPQMHYVASRATSGAVQRATGLVRPSGVLSVATVAHAQAILIYLGHLARDVSSVTGAVDAATRAGIALFQDNFNRENACRRHDRGAPCQAGRVYGPPLQPRSLPVNGDLTPDTRAALGNYASAAALGGYGLGASRAQIEAWSTRAAQGVGSGPASIAATAPVVQAPVAQAPVAQAPDLNAAPVVDSEAPRFPAGPLLAIVGVAVIVGVVAWTQSGAPAQPKYFRKAR
jgi:hypothetical protein